MSDDPSHVPTSQCDVSAPKIAAGKPPLMPAADVTAQSAAAVSAVETTAITAQPVTTPPSLAPARAIARSKMRQPAEFPKRILKMMNSETGLTARILFSHPPILAGQSVNEYFDLVEAVVLDFPPFSYRDLALVKQIVDAEWKILTFGEVQKMLLNAEIAQGLVDELVGLDEPSEDRQTRLRAWRRLVFGAISGDPVMVEQLEKNVGAGLLGLTAYTVGHMERIYSPKTR